MQFLELRTITLISFIETLLLGLIFLYFSHLRKKYPGTREFALSLLIVSASSVLFSIQSPSLPFLTIVVANLVFFTGTAFTPYGLRKFFGVETRPRYYLIMSVLVFGLIYYNTIISPENIRIRIITMSLSIILVYLETSWLMFVFGKGTIKRAARTFSLIYIVMASQYIWRVYYTITSDKISYNMMNAPHGAESTMYALNIIMSLISCVCAYTLFIMMVNLKLEDEIVEGEAKLRNYAGDLEKSARAKNKFLAVISKDLKTPVEEINSLIGSMASEKELPDDVAMDIEILNKTCGGLVILLTNLLDWAGAQTGKIDINPEKISLSEAVPEAVGIHEISARRKKIAVKFEALDDKYVLSDRKTLSTMLINLLSNAIKFTREGGTVCISADASDGEVKISIRDNGVGMAPDKLEQLFKLDRSAYYSSGTAGEIGTGLGLLICKEFAGLNGGSISVESVHDKGTTVTLTIPTVHVPRH